MEWFALAAKNMGFHVGFHEDSIQNGIYKKTYNLRVLAKKYLDYIPSLGSKDFRSEVGSCYRYSFDHGTNFSRGPWVKTEFDSQGLRCAWNRVYQPIRDHFDRTNDDFHNLMLEHSIFRQSHICPFSCWSSEDQNDIEADLRCILTQIEWGCGWFLSVRGGGKARVINPILVIFNDETKVCGKPCSFPETRMVYLWVLFHAFPQVYQFSSLAAQSWSSSVPWLKGFACCRISGLPALWVSHQVDMNFPLYFTSFQSIAKDGNTIYCNRWQHICTETFLRVGVGTFFSKHSTISGGPTYLSRLWCIMELFTFAAWMCFVAGHGPHKHHWPWIFFCTKWKCKLWLGQKHHWPWIFSCNGNGSNYCWFFKDRNYQCVCFWSSFSLVSWHFFRGPTRKRPRRLVVLTGPHWRKALWHQRDPNLTPR